MIFSALPEQAKPVKTVQVSLWEAKPTWDQTVGGVMPATTSFQYWDWPLTQSLSTGSPVGPSRLMCDHIDLGGRVLEGLMYSQAYVTLQTTGGERSPP